VRGDNLIAVADEIPELTMDLDIWEVTLKSGDVLTLRAHGVKVEAGYWVFVALMRGEPHYEYELMRVSASVVDDVQGG